jgi:hypothetical protein
MFFCIVSLNCQVYYKIDTLWQVITGVTGPLHHSTISSTNFFPPFPEAAFNIAGWL